MAETLRPDTEVDFGNAELVKRQPGQEGTIRALEEEVGRCNGIIVELSEKLERLNNPFINPVLRHLVYLNGDEAGWHCAVGIAKDIKHASSFAYDEAREICKSYKEEGGNPQLMIDPNCADLLLDKIRFLEAENKKLKEHNGEHQSLNSTQGIAMRKLGERVDALERRLIEAEKLEVLVFRMIKAENQILGLKGAIKQIRSNINSLKKRSK